MGGAKGRPDRSHRPKRIRCDTSWQEHALCAQEHANFDPDPSDIIAVAVAKQICRRCTVQDACLEWALNHRENHGIWGGHTPDERWALERKKEQDRRVPV